jgi:hypothetical protein
MLSGGETLLGLQRVDPRAPVGFGPPPELGGTGDPITYAGDASLFGTPATLRNCAYKSPLFPNRSLSGSWTRFAPLLAYRRPLPRLRGRCHNCRTTAG